MSKPTPLSADAQANIRAGVQKWLERSKNYDQFIRSEPKPVPLSAEKKAIALIAGRAFPGFNPGGSSTSSTFPKALPSGAQPTGVDASTVPAMANALETMTNRIVGAFDGLKAVVLEERREKLSQIGKSNMEDGKYKRVPNPGFRDNANNPLRGHKFDAKSSYEAGRNPDFSRPKDKAEFDQKWAEWRAQPRTVKKTAGDLARTGKTIERPDIEVRGGSAHTIYQTPTTPPPPPALKMQGGVLRPNPDWDKSNALDSFVDPITSGRVPASFSVLPLSSPVRQKYLGKPDVEQDTMTRRQALVAVFSANTDAISENAKVAFVAGRINDRQFFAELARAKK